MADMNDFWAWFLPDFQSDKREVEKIIAEKRNKKESTEDVKEVENTETESVQVNASKVTVKADALPQKDEGTPVPEISTEPAKGDEPHMLLGKELEQYGLKPRARDADGLGALQHGSPWIAPISSLDAIFGALRKKGYLSSVPTPKQLNPKKGASFRKPQSTVMVEMGTDSKNVYLYITDDNEKKK